jgi:glycosyltransferase involved in cell wall biosynthesis
MDRVPCLLVGDGPQEATGLGRIARDIGLVLHTQNVGIDLLQVGGVVPPLWSAWPHVPMGDAERGDDWGAAFCEALYLDRWGREPGVLFVVWDPARAYAFLRWTLPVQKWCYTAVDSHNRWGGLSGAPAEALRRFDRVLGYGRWASEVIHRVRDGAMGYLPHGLWLHSFRPPSEEEQASVRELLGPHLGREAILIGCVAANQARKDLALFFEALMLLRERGVNAYGWLHTDLTTRAWSIDELVADCNLQQKITVTLGTLSDRQLACLYQRCDATIAPGLGEGFGYPIVESLAAGVPVIHGDFGGGSELVPKSEWRVPVREIRRESIYGLTRPVFRAEDVANAVQRALDWRMAVGRELCAAYCRGAVAHLDWNHLLPRWRGWIREGLR